MSHAVMRGAPTKAQIYLDSILDEMVAESGREEDRYSLAKILFKCLRDNPHDIRHIEGNSGEIDTNRSLLERSIRTSLALQHAQLQPGDTVLIITRNNIEVTSLYFGSMFAGVVLYFLHVGINAYELKHFLNINKPSMIFIENESLPAIEQALQETKFEIKVILFGDNNLSGHQSFSKFITGFENGVESFRPTNVDKEAPVINISTSGTTGLPKAAVLNSRGLVAQLASVWTYHERFPRPTGIYLCTTNPSWITHTMATTSCAAFGVTVLYTSAKINAEHIKMLLRKYKPTFALMPAYLATALLSEPGLRNDDLFSLDTICLAGSAIPEHLLVKCQEHLRPGSRACNVYGTTELQGYVTFPRPGAPLPCIGTIINCIDFKIVDEEGNTLGPNQPGELWLKSKECIFKEYVNNEKAYKEAFSHDGWFRTGDKVYTNEHEDVFFVDRIKFLIKYQNHHISPSEVEEVITQLKGVQSAAVCETELGPAAVVALQPGSKVIPQNIHDAINSTLSDVKRLRGGVVFVPSIPLSVNGKTDRNKVKEMLQEVTKAQIHYMLM